MAETQRQQSTKCDGISNINNDDNGNKDESSDDNDNDDGDSDSGNDDEYDDDNDDDDGNGNNNGNGDGDGDGDSGDDNNNNDDDGGGSRWATAAANGVVWGRRQATEVAEMGIKWKWEECGYDRQNFSYRYRTIVMWVTFYMYPTAFPGY